MRMISTSSTELITGAIGAIGVPSTNYSGDARSSSSTFTQDQLLRLKIRVNNQAKKTVVQPDLYYMTNLLNVLSKKDKSLKGKMIFDHFI